MITHCMHMCMVHVRICTNMNLCKYMNLCKLVCKYGGSSYIRIRLADEIDCVLVYVFSSNTWRRLFW